MMAAEILARLSELGVQVNVDGAKLRFIPGSLVPQTLASEIRAHKDELLDALRQHEPSPVQDILGRLRQGHLWLTDVHMRLLDEREVYQGMEEKFLEMLDLWDALDLGVRRAFGFEGCVTGVGQRCPDDSPVRCRGCADESSDDNPDTRRLLT